MYTPFKAPPVCSLGTSALLEPAVDLPNGIYQVPILVKDLQGFGKEQEVSIRLCECTKEGVCVPRSLSTTLGVWGILALLLGLLLLLLLCKCPLLAMTWIINSSALNNTLYYRYYGIDVGSMVHAFNSSFLVLITNFKQP